MKDFRVIPIWLWITVIIIIVLLCSSCRGGRSLGSGSAGTIILPRTPRQINESNRLEKVAPPFDPQPLAPVPIIPKSAPVAPIEPSYSGPDTEILKKSVTPKAETTTIIAGDGGRIPHPPLPKNGDNKATVTINGNDDKRAEDDPRFQAPLVESLQQEEPKKSFINWGELTYYYLFLFLSIILGWIVYDTVKKHKSHNKTASKPTKKTDLIEKGKKSEKAKGSKKKTRKIQKDDPQGNVL
tara:strand:+ start:936 stop:1655 length:720 start_codon:yes stop_codon:yes gene_type:complete